MFIYFLLTKKNINKILSLVEDFSHFFEIKENFVKQNLHRNFLALTKDNHSLRITTILLYFLRMYTTFIIPKFMSNTLTLVQYNADKIHF